MVNCVNCVELNHQEMVDLSYLKLSIQSIKKLKKTLEKKELHGATRNTFYMDSLRDAQIVTIIKYIWTTLISVIGVGVVIW